MNLAWNFRQRLERLPSLLLFQSIQCSAEPVKHLTSLTIIAVSATRIYVRPNNQNDAAMCIHFFWENWPSTLQTMALEMPEFTVSNKVNKKTDMKIASKTYIIFLFLRNPIEN